MMDRRTIWVAGVILFGSFMVGFLLGGGSMWVVSKKRPASVGPQVQADPPARPEKEFRRKPMETVLLKRMELVLGLDEVQSLEVAKELQRASEAFDRLHRSTWEEMKGILASADHAIKGQLDERQVGLYEEHFVRKRLREGLGRPPLRHDWGEKGGPRGPRDNERRRGVFPPEQDPGSEPAPPQGDPL